MIVTKGIGTYSLITRGFGYSFFVVSTNNLVLLSELKEYLNIVGTDLDELLQLALDVAQSEVESYCNRRFTKGNYTQYSSGSGGDEMLIRNYPIESIGSIKAINLLKSHTTYKNLFLGSDSVNDSLFIIPEVNGVKLIKRYNFPRGYRNIRIRYSSGWDASNCPADLKGVILEMASVFFFNTPTSGQARLGKKSEGMSSSASVSVEFKDLRPNWKDRLNKYRLAL